MDPPLYCFRTLLTSSNKVISSLSRVLSSSPEIAITTIAGKLLFSPGQQAISPSKDDCSSNGDENCVERTALASESKCAHNPTADQCARDANQNVDKRPVPRAAHDFSRSPTGNQAYETHQTKCITVCSDLSSSAPRYPSLIPRRFWFVERSATQAESPFRIMEAVSRLDVAWSLSDRTMVDGSASLCLIEERYPRS